MRYPILLAGILHALALPAFAGAEVVARGYAEGDDLGVAAQGPTPQQTGVVPLSRDTQVAYEVGVGETEVRGNVTTRHRLSKHEMLNLRLEREGGGAYWSRRFRGREQRLGLFSADFGLADQRLLGWEYADGYTLGEEAAPSRSAFSSWSATGLRAAAAPPPGPAGARPVEDAVGNRVRAAYAEEHGRVRQAVRAEGPLPEGRRDMKFAAGGSAETGAPFVGGALRQGLTSTWTVEAGGYADQAAAVYAKSRLRLGGGVLKFETRSDDATRGSSRRASYVFRNAALAVERQGGGGSVGARLYGSRYYAAADHGLGDGDDRLVVGYTTTTALGRVAVTCEAREGRGDSRYCGVGLQVPLRSGAGRGAPAAGMFRRNRSLSANGLY